MPLSSSSKTVAPIADNLLFCIRTIISPIPMCCFDFSVILTLFVVQCIVFLLVPDCDLNTKNYNLSVLLRKHIQQITGRNYIIKLYEKNDQVDLSKRLKHVTQSKPTDYTVEQRRRSWGIDRGYFRLIS